MEIDASSINVHEGDDVSITCDGSCVGTNYNPYLRWYGPDRYWIASQDQNDRYLFLLFCFVLFCFVLFCLIVILTFRKLYYIILQNLEVF